MLLSESLPISLSAELSDKLAEETLLEVDDEALESSLLELWLLLWCAWMIVVGMGSIPFNLHSI